MADVRPLKATTAWFEWSTIWLLLQRDGKVWKEDLRGVYDVSLCLASICSAVVYVRVTRWLC